MSAAATALDGCTRVPASTVAIVTPRLTDAAYRAVVEHVAVDVDGLRMVPDSLLVEVVANGHRPPRTASLSWPDHEQDQALAGRLVWVYRLPDPRPKHPDDMANRY